MMPVSARVDLFDFSAHADRPGLLGFVDEYRDARILVNHGDRCVDFAQDLRSRGVDASAPGIGETISL